MSENLYKQGIPTERCLAVIGFSDGSAIGQKCAQSNPTSAHLRYLKQARHAPQVKASIDYFIKRRLKTVSGGYHANANTNRP